MIALRERLARSNSLAGGEELVRRSKVLQLGIRTLRELALHTFIPRNFAVNRRFKSCCEDYSTLCTLFMPTKYTIASY